MAKYLDENGLKTLISDIKRDIQSTAWKDENGDISEEFLTQVQDIVTNSIRNNESVQSIEDINDNLKSSLKYIFNLGTKTTNPTEFSTGQYVNSGLIFENTGYATWDFKGDSTTASRVGSLILVKSDIDFWVPEDTTKIYKFNGKDILAFSVTTSNSQVICDTLTNDKISGKFSTNIVNGEWNPDTTVFVSSDVVDPTASSSVTSIKLVKAATLPAGLYMVTGIGQVTNILSGIQYAIDVNSITTREIMKPVESLQCIKTLNDLLKAHISDYDDQISAIGEQFTFIENLFTNWTGSNEYPDYPSQSVANIDKNLRNEQTRIEQNRLDIQELKSRVEGAESEATGAVETVKTADDKVNWVLNELFNVGGVGTPVKPISTEQIIISEYDDNDLFSHTLSNNFINNDLKLSGKVSSQGSILCVQKSADYWSTTVKNIYDGDTVIPIYAMRVVKGLGNSYSADYLSSVDYKWHILSTLQITRGSNYYSIIVEGQLIGGSGTGEEILLKDIDKVTIPAGLYMVMDQNIIVNVVSGMQYTLTDSGVKKLQLYTPFMPQEYNIEPIINAIEGKYNYFSFKSSDVQTEQGDLMIGFDGDVNGNSLTLLNFNDLYENTKEYDCIEFGGERNNVLKTNIKGSNIFGELKLIPINTEHSPKDVDINATYISSHRAPGYTNIGQDYCLVFTGRGTLSSLTVSAGGDNCHTVKISADDSTTVKMSSIYPVYLFRNKTGGFDLLTLSSLDSSLKIS